MRSVEASSSHFIFGLPLRLVAYSFPYNIFFGIAVNYAIYRRKSNNEVEENVTYRPQYYDLLGITYRRIFNM
jgi:hypothetical protein